MKLTLNGKEHELADLATVGDLLAALGLSAEVAVAVNGEVVPRRDHAATVLRPGDEVEIIHAVAGG